MGTTALQLKQLLRYIVDHSLVECLAYPIRKCTTVARMLGEDVVPKAAYLSKIGSQVTRWRYPVAF
jgi:hypothetical protein